MDQEIKVGQLVRLKDTTKNIITTHREVFLADEMRLLANKIDNEGNPIALVVSAPTPDRPYELDFNGLIVFLSKNDIELTSAIELACEKTKRAQK